MSKRNISISVRSLVEFILRSGDIDNRSGGGFDQEAMLAGGRIHRKIQKGMAGDYRAEVALSDEIDCGTYILKVEGRADGVFTDDGSGRAVEVSTSVPVFVDCTDVGAAKATEEKENAAADRGFTDDGSGRAMEVSTNVPVLVDCTDVRVAKATEEKENAAAAVDFTDDGSDKTAEDQASVPIVVVDEIKGVYMNPDELEEPVLVHLAQAKCYGAILLRHYLSEGWNGNPCRTDKIGIRMTYVNLEDESRMRYYTSVYARDEILSWYEELCAKYRKWTDWQNSWQSVRDASMEPMSFPFEYRKGQKGLVSSVYHTILNEKQLFLMAPTGVGKTMAVVYPSVRAVGQGMADKIFYLTAKNQTLAVGAEAFRILSGEGLRMKVIVLTSKEKICPLNEPSCNPDDCPYAKGHFDRVNDAVFEILGEAGSFDRDADQMGLDAFDRNDCLVEAYSFDGGAGQVAADANDKKDGQSGTGSFDRNGKCNNLTSADRVIGQVHLDYYDRDALRVHADKWKVCPFELGLDISSWCDAVLCDYNYAFDPNARLRRFFGEGMKGKYIFLVDEAHNLVDRAREMYSAELVKEDVLAAKNAIKGTSPKVARQLERLNKLLLQMRKKLTAEENVEPDRLGKYEKIAELDEKFVRETLGTYGMMQEYFKERSGSGREGSAENSAGNDGINESDSSGTDRPAEKADALLEFYFELRDFVSTYEVMADDYVIYAYMDGEKHFHMKFFCMSPARRLQEIVDKGRAAVFFSATFLPASYYKELLSRREDPYAAYAESPFDDERKVILIGQDVSTRYRSRGDTMYRRIAFYIHETVLAKKGNYMAFFPSYRFMQDVLRIFQAEFDEEEVDYVAQSRYMNEMDREIFLENFYEDPGRTMVGFCVMGGIFAEGIDLTGSKLIGSIIVGCGLPQVSAETELIREHYDGRGETKKGFSYAYLIPGMNKVMQSAGRVIRTATDRGVIVLLDDRFLTGECQSLFPREWKSYIPCRAEQVREILTVFWGKELCK